MYVSTFLNRLLEEKVQVSLNVYSCDVETVYAVLSWISVDLNWISENLHLLVYVHQ